MKIQDDKALKKQWMFLSIQHRKHQRKCLHNENWQITSFVKESLRHVGQPYGTQGYTYHYRIIHLRWMLSEYYVFLKGRGILFFLSLFRKDHILCFLAKILINFQSNSSKRPQEPQRKWFGAICLIYVLFVHPTRSLLHI